MRRCRAGRRFAQTERMQRRDAGNRPVERRPPRGPVVSAGNPLPAALVMTEGASRPRPAPPRKPDSLSLSWSRWDDPPPPAPEPTPPGPVSHIRDDFGGFSPYTPPTPIQTERLLPNRPQSVIAQRPSVVNQLARRPHSIGAIEDEWQSVPLLHPVARRPRPVPNTLSTLPRAQYSMPASRSDYQLQRPAIMTNGYGAVPPSTSRRLSLPGGPVQNPPKPSATFHGLSALALGVYPTLSTPVTPTTPAAVREAVRHLLQQPRNGFPIMDHKLSLFIEILDAQEKFSQVC